ncbi:hypothetical protein ABG067_006727 [Albugo candida]
MLAGKRIVICGFGDVGKGSAQAMKAAGAIVFVTEVDPICALQACMEGFQVVRLSTVVSTADIFITTTDSNKYQVGKVYVLPKELDEKVARLHLSNLGDELTELTCEQADYIDVNIAGLFKPETYVWTEFLVVDPQAVNALRVFSTSLWMARSYLYPL